MRRKHHYNSNEIDTHKTRFMEQYKQKQSVIISEHDVNGTKSTKLKKLL